jgi:hypothetical protein
MVERTFKTSGPAPGDARPKEQRETKVTEEQKFKASKPAPTIHISSAPSPGSRLVFTLGGNREMRDGLAIGATDRGALAPVTIRRTMAAAAASRRHARTRRRVRPPDTSRLDCGRLINTPGRNAAGIDAPTADGGRVAAGRITRSGPRIADRCPPDVRVRIRPINPERSNYLKKPPCSGDLAMLCSMPYFSWILRLER